jgi:RNA polymerase sigma factor (sigma-70 family)
MNALADLVIAAQNRNVEAYGRLVHATQTMAYAVALSVLKDSTAAQDAVQQAYLRAFGRLGDLQEPATFAGWLRRIVITSSLNVRRARRWTFVPLDDAQDVPVLDEVETRWSEAQRLRLAHALLTLTPEERQLCDRRYHGGWSTARLAANAGVDDRAMRKRLQRIRDKLRKEMEVAEQRAIRPDEIRTDLPATVVELLARPKLTDLPENPVGKTLDLLRSAYPEFAERRIPELVDLAEAKKTVVSEAMYIDPVELHRVDEHRILRYDLTLPLLLAVRYEGQPLRMWTAGKCYRLCQQDAMHLEAFHQAEVLWVDERERLDPWQMTGRVLRSVDRALPGRTVKIVPTEYAMCSQAWELEVDDDGRWSEVLAWGVYSHGIVRHLGADPERHVAVGVGYGLERIAMLRYGIDDARKIDVASVA